MRGRIAGAGFKDRRGRGWNSGDGQRKRRKRQLALSSGFNSGQFKFELVILRPANVFGLGHFWGGSSGGAKMQELMEAGISGRPAQIPAYDTQDVEYVYAKDIGTAIDLAATVPAPKEHTFNIGNGRVTRFDELLAAVRGIYPKLQIEIEPGDKPASKSEPMDISRAAKTLGWLPQFTLLNALEDYHTDLAAARRHA